jgi:hypothetical protein
MMRISLLSLLSILFLCAASPLPVEASLPCAEPYGAVPEQAPDRLRVDIALNDLATQNRYDLLAGHLLQGGFVDGSACPSGGIYPDGSPNGCGIEVAYSEMVRWQNQYDQAILASATASNVPPYLLKGMIAAESQFWPAGDWAKGEIGLGQMTASGADLLLSYRPKTYYRVCEQVFGEEECRKPYSELSEDNQAMLRGWVLGSMDVTCPTCMGGINASKGIQAVGILAETLAASCSQSAHVIRMATGKTPASLMSYEDYWRFTLANYHSGSGCMYQALRRSGNPTNWPAIASGWPHGCLSGITYIRRIEENIAP